MSEAAPEVAAPVATPGAADTATPAPDASAAPSDPQPATGGEKQPEPAPDRTFTKAELDKIVDRARAKESRRAERFAYERFRREAAERELERLRGQPTGDRGEQTTARAPGEKPRQEDFKDWDAYNEAVLDWKLEQRLSKESEDRKRQETSEAEAKYAKTVQERMVEGAQKYDDFEEVISGPGVVFTQAMTDALLKTEKPADVAYNLAQNAKETQRIASLSIADQVLEIKAFAASLTKPPAPTTAPEPIKPGKAEGAVEKTLESTANNYADWLKVRNRQLGRK
jgi:hypothetical protein